MAVYKRLCDTNGIQNGKGSIATDGLCCMMYPSGELSMAEASMEDVVESLGPLEGLCDIASDYPQMMSGLRNRRFQQICGL